ncbi:MAG: 3-hydroxyacyl-CoA dehydrogenase family protein, partial [Candidatus Eremiobacteraeota bacterium]|nr:3-hydroxyacyl-CoA dehydrogenase family protein [Candidatus Eremiobacteraeota bacterium]
SSATLAIEAAPERLDLKRAIFAQLGTLLPAPAVLATNTSSLAVSEIAAGVPAPERVVGIHFFNPPSLMELVEIVRAPESSDAALEVAGAFVRAIGKTAVVASDTPGFIVNRVARPFYLQALHALTADVAPVSEMDGLARAAGFRMGPFELMDLIGLDVNLATTESIYDRTGAERLAPVPLQAQMVSQNRLGRKTKAGFYDYSDGVPARHTSPLQAPSERNDDERVVVVGFGSAALDLRERLESVFSHVTLIENDDLLDEMPMDTTIVVDTGDGVSDRSDIVRQMDTVLPPQTAIFVDAYAADVDMLAKKLSHPERVVGYGILGSLSAQDSVEIADSVSGDDALELAQEFFEQLGKRAVLVASVPGLFLGRVVCSIINEAVCAVQDGVASAEDVDLAMRLGTNYPIGPIAWGREIGGARVSHILHRLAASEGKQYSPHRALWILDAEVEPVA